MKLSPGRQHAPALAALSAAALLVTLRSWIGKRWNALALYRGVERRPVCGSVSKLLSSTRRCHLRPSKQTSLYSVVSHGSCSRSAASKEAKPVVAPWPAMSSLGAPRWQQQGKMQQTRSTCANLAAARATWQLAAAARRSQAAPPRARPGTLY